MNIDRNLINPPTLNFTKIALIQLKLIKTHDYTINDKIFRIQITGKGCDGFTYSTGFTSNHPDDFQIKIEDLFVALDPFTAYYLNNATIDYFQDFDQEEEGFIVINKYQKNYAGKFWKENPDKIPPLIK